LLVLVRELPGESAYMRATGMWWTPEMELAAQMIEVSWLVLRQVAALGATSSSQIPPAFTYPRPESVLAAAAAHRREERRGAQTLSDYRQMFAGRG
jgi:hypothetical protein